MRIYAKQAKMGLENQNHCAFIKIFAERRGGELLREIKNRLGKSGVASTNARAASFRPQVEILEGRQLMSASKFCTVRDPSTGGALNFSAQFNDQQIHIWEGTYGQYLVDLTEDFRNVWDVSAVTAGNNVSVFANDTLGHLWEITFDPSARLFTTWHDMQWNVQSFDTFADSQGVGKFRHAHTGGTNYAGLAQGGRHSVRRSRLRV